MNYIEILMRILYSRTLADDIPFTVLLHHPYLIIGKRQSLITESSPGFDYPFFGKISLLLKYISVVIH